MMIKILMIGDKTGGFFNCNMYKEDENLIKNKNALERI